MKCFHTACCGVTRAGDHLAAPEALRPGAPLKRVEMWLLGSPCMFHSEQRPCS